MAFDGYNTAIGLGAYVVSAFRCIGALLAYVAPCLLVLVPLRFLTKVPSFVFRKLLHVVAFTCISLMILSADCWQAAVLASVLVAAFAYPVLALLEKKAWFPTLFVEKRPGEIKTSLILLFSMFAALTALCWGLFGKPHLAIAAILMWGTGDAAAALVGIPFGKHKVKLRMVDGKKSWEGSAAMFAVSFLLGLITLLPVQGMEPLRALLLAGLGALMGMVTELLSPSEYDTVTVPIVIAAVLLALHSL